MFEYRQKRHVDLEAAIRLFAFNGECDDFDKWLQDKAKQLNQDNEGDTVEAAKLNFEVLPVFFFFFFFYLLTCSLVISQRRCIV